MDDTQTVLQQFFLLFSTNRLNVIRECEAFFRSEWFSFLMDINGQYVQRKLREEL